MHEPRKLTNPTLRYRGFAALEAPSSPSAPSFRHHVPVRVHGSFLSGHVPLQLSPPSVDDRSKNRFAKPPGPGKGSCSWARASLMPCRGRWVKHRVGFRVKRSSHQVWGTQRQLDTAGHSRPTIEEFRREHSLCWQCHLCELASSNKGY